MRGIVHRLYRMNIKDSFLLKEYAVRKTHTYSAVITADKLPFSSIETVCFRSY